MKTTQLRSLAFALAGLLSAPALADDSSVGAVYSMTNLASGNEILVYGRAADGGLRLEDRVSTEGLGDEQGLGSEGGLVLDDHASRLYAVNPGSDEISVFRVTGRGLELESTVSSRGPRPISVTVHDDRVYVLNGGRGDAEGNIAGFRHGRHGELVPLAQAPTPLGGTNAELVPSQIAFSPDGDVLILTQRGVGRVRTFTFGRDGGLESADSIDTERESFGFDVHRDRLVVSEANGSVSSYLVDDTGGIEVVEREPGQPSACWVVIGRNGRFVFVANTGSRTLSSFRLGRDGSLEAVALAVPTGAAGPGDLALSRDGAFLYARLTDNTIGAYRVSPDGQLEPAGIFADGLPINGIAAR